MPRVVRTEQDPALQRVRRDLQMLQQILAGMASEGVKTKAILNTKEAEDVGVYLLMQRRKGDVGAQAMRFTHRSVWRTIKQVGERAQPILMDEEE